MLARTGRDRTYQKEDVGISLRALGGQFKHHRLHYCLPMDRKWSYYTLHRLPAAPRYIPMLEMSANDDTLKGHTMRHL